MTDERLLPPSPAVAGGRASPEVLRLVGLALAVYAGSRILTSGVLLWLTTRTTAASEAGPHPTFSQLSAAWDGRWYRLIALHGYPARLPVAPDGQVQQNAWAFLPAYPWLARGAAWLTGLDWSAAAVAVSLLFGAGAAVMLAVLLLPRVGPRRALAAVALLCCSPVAFVLQTAYADSMMLCLLLVTLHLVEHRRFLAAVPVVAAASFTRPGSLALALALGLLMVVRRRELLDHPHAAARAGTLLLTACAGGFAWPLVAAVATGRPAAYVETETAWRSLWMGAGDFAPFAPWVFVAQQLFGVLGLPVLAALVVGGVHLLRAPMRPLGGTLRAWCGAYALYLLAVLMPQTSLPRLLLPLAPALGALPALRRTPFAVLLVSSMLLQLLWLWCTYGPAKTWLTVP